MTVELLLGINNIILLCALVGVFAYFDKVRSRDSERWTAALNQVSDAHAEELRRMANMKMAGVPEIPAAVRIPMKPDAEARAAADIREDTIRRGMENLQMRYREQGLTLSDEEARTQVEAMIAGRSLSVA